MKPASISAMWGRDIGSDRAPGRRGQESTSCRSLASDLYSPAERRDDQTFIREVVETTHVPTPATDIEDLRCQTTFTTIRTVSS